jgi:23S rRNA maturation mini-RNase III
MLEIEMASPKQYHPTVKGIFEWANSELEHVGRIASVEDPDLQYSYAMSTVNGMAYLKDAIYELVNDSKYSTHKEDLLRLHGAVIRTMKRLVKDYKVNLSAIKTFNTRKVLSNRNFTYLKKGKNRDTRKNRKTRKNRN